MRRVDLHDSSSSTKLQTFRHNKSLCTKEELEATAWDFTLTDLCSTSPFYILLQFVFRRKWKKTPLDENKE